MQKRSHTEISSLIVFLSILTIVIQFAAYYFFASIYVILGVALLTMIICSHILLEQSQTYESSFIFTTLTLFISVIITILTYFSRDQLFPYSNILIGINVINWYIPSIYCYIRNMFDYGSRIENYTHYFRNSSIVFIIFYFGLLLYGNFASDAFPWAYQAMAEHANFTPFWSLAIQIEDYLNKMIPIGDIIVYLCSRILTFLPYGFFVILLLRRQSRILRFFTLLIFPLALELFQYFIVPERCDIDDVIYALIGGLLGAILFHLTNTIFRAVSGKNFLAKNSDFRYSNSSLHF